MSDRPHATSDMSEFHDDTALLLAMIDDKLDDSQFEDLMDRLRTEPELRRQALLVAGDEAIIREWAESSSVNCLRREIENDLLGRSMSQIRRRKLHRRIFFTASVVMLSLFAVFFYVQSLNSKTEIATVTRTVGAKWKNASPLKNRTSLIEGQAIDLAAGQVEITYETGARVWLQGPVMVRLASSRSIEISSGQLAVDVGTAKTTEKSTENRFTVITPAARVVDLGTRFALSVENETIDLVVYQGAVQTQSLEATDAKPIDSTAGEAVRIDSKVGTSKPSPESRKKFEVLKQRLAERTITASADHYICGGKHSDQVDASCGGPMGDTMLLKRYRNFFDVCRKAWIRFDLSKIDYDPARPATFVFYHNEPSDDADFHGTIAVSALKPGFKPGKNEQGIDWNQDTLTWNNAPGNERNHPWVDTRRCLEVGEVEVDTLRPDQPRGTAYEVSIPNISDLLQEDGTITLILWVVRQDGPSANLSIASSESEDVDGPQLIVPTRQP